MIVLLKHAGLSSATSDHAVCYLCKSKHVQEKDPTEGYGFYYGQIEGIYESQNTKESADPCKITISGYDPPELCEFSCVSEAARAIDKAKWEMFHSDSIEIVSKVQFIERSRAAYHRLMMRCKCGGV